jgi:hypothetical protein
MQSDILPTQEDQSQSVASSVISVMSAVNWYDKQIGGQTFQDQPPRLQH